MKQKFQKGCRVDDPSDARDKEKENCQPNSQDDASELPAKKQRQKSTSKSRIASEGMWMSPACIVTKCNGRFFKCKRNGRTVVAKPER